MSKRKKTASIGGELVRRLKRFAETLENTEEIAERFTCRSVKLNLGPMSFRPEMVRETREVIRASQAIFAQFLGVSLSAVRDWEQGIKPPNGAACRLMDEIRRNPEYFVSRLKELSSAVNAKKPA
jgi:putative transcriptional regulator